jgi:rubrerythrin
MTPEIKTMAEGLFQAIQAEADGQHFYLMAANCTQDSKGREVFALLAGEEEAHQLFLKGQYRALTETGKPSTALRMPPRAELAGPSPIFSLELKRRIKDAHFEMSALSIGIQLELSAIAHYQSCAGKAADPLVAAFFQELADWERGHHQALLSQQEALKQGYWAENGFAPF